MNPPQEARWKEALATLRAAGLWRELQPLQPEGDNGFRLRDAQGHALLSFASNDYLGLAGHPVLRAAAQEEMALSGVGAGAAPLLGGERPAHAALAEALARWLGVEAVLLFGSGYLANLGIFAALVGRSDGIYADRLNHSSLVDGARLAGAHLGRYRHGDLDHLETLLQRHSGGRRWIVSDGVFSMDGDIAPLADLARLAERYDATIILDEAHAFGVIGAGGRGSVAHWQLDPARVGVRMGTLGKAFGVYGAFVAGSQPLIDLLRHRARSFVYHTAFPPMLAHVRHLRGASAPGSWMPSGTPIQPLLVGEAGQSLALSRALREQGLYVPAVRPPTVPMGAARLRITLSAAHAPEDVDRLRLALEQCR
ncbi:MAG: 8-amino-7-oxononanoate synthase [Acidithiobacillus ferrivorans]|uniref:8-amino-7-oxononanoate synthase n=1 Tax=Acidithiobacillus ferrivorans TaxID=160808 RepID=A0A257T6B0_9PROT|nr:MAG: 8-amino-7-oxononanoate synthase [Acidithiobacillus ferrivorans]